MKKFGFMLMAAAAVALSLSSCKKDNKEEELPVPTPTPVDIETPAVDGTEGAVTIVIRFDEAPCEGADVLFVGSHRDNEWKIAEAPAFEAIGDGWYKFVAYPNEGGTISGRPIQYDGETADWGNDWSHSGDDIILVKGGSEGNIADSGYGEVNLSFTEADAADAAVVFIVCKKWNAKPCAAAAEYNLTVLVPAFCGEEFDLEVVGNFEEGDGWGSAPIAMTKEAEGKYTATVSAKAGQQFKVRGVGDWDKGVQVFVDPDEANPEGSWKDVDNNVFGNELNITVDYSADTYRWKTCAEPAEAVPGGNHMFIVTITNREWNPADECIFTGNFAEKAWGESDRKMTYDRATRTWSWTGEYPENFEYKVIYNGTWATGENVKFDGVTYEAEFAIAEE